MAWIITYMIASYDDKWWKIYNIFYSVDFYREDLMTNTAKATINIDNIKDIWYWKYWIIWIDEPNFISVTDLDKYNYLTKNTPWAIVKLWWEYRFYPINILEKHQIINDKIAGTHFSIAYSPYSWVLVWFNRRVWENILKFWTSWKVYESWDLLYDFKTESLWSLSTLEALVWDYYWTKLDYINITTSTLWAFLDNYENWRILIAPENSDKNYQESKFEEYAFNDEIKFDLLNSINISYWVKEKFIVINDRESWESLVFNLSDLITEKEWILQVWNDYYKAEIENSEIKVTKNYSPIEHFYEYWFSWSNINFWNDNIWAAQKKDE